MNIHQPEDWKLVSLQDIGEVNRGRSRHRPRYAEHLYGGPYPFIQTGDIKSSNGRITSFKQTYSEAGLAQSRLWPVNTLCITIAANIAETAILTFPACFPDSVVGFIADPSKANVQFIEYTFRFMRKQIQHQAIGSVQDNINLETINRLKIPLPPLPVQQRIADILGALDDKIELNRRMNATLEAMARALFKSWFVDFDPVHAKAAGQPTGLPAHIDALFPSAFVDSPLGQIPQGWGVGRLDDLLILQRGFDLPSTSRSIGKFPVVSAGGISGYHDKFMVKGPGVTTGRSGVLGNVFYISDDYWPLNTSLYIKSFLKATPLYAFYILQTVDFNLFNAGSAVPSLNRNHVHNLPVVLPPDECIKTFDMYSQSKIDLQQIYSLQSDNLTHLRDTLLPKLLSGEMEV